MKPFKSKKKPMPYTEFVRTKDIPMLAHQIEMNCYEKNKKNMECFRAALEAIVLSTGDGTNDAEYINYLKKGY